MRALELTMSFRKKSDRGRDPYWMTARFSGVCSASGKRFISGARVFYYPAERKYLVGDNAEVAAAEFAASKFDEEVYASWGGGY